MTCDFKPLRDGRWRCMRCNYITVKCKNPPVRSCNGKQRTTPKRVMGDVPCKYCGSHVGGIDCGCCGKTKVYYCERFEEYVTKHVANIRSRMIQLVKGGEEKFDGRLRVCIRCKERKS